ncbi:hypothetical protein [uncultured Brevibacillus sp.]|uniref:hypothetical protein n=1 Tax=uncultured Brevibacillus sp. TaxID=169970 RepID=UPI002595590B|nr:hypothetical protein [uncultured Brevibacillus sp.]
MHRQNPYLAEALKAVEDTGDVTGSLEKVVELQPDLIVTGGNQNRDESLSKIAPTISIPYGKSSGQSYPMNCYPSMPVTISS